MGWPAFQRLLLSYFSLRIQHLYLKKLPSYSALNYTFVFWTPVHICVEGSGQLVVLLGGGLEVLRGHISYPATLISRPDMKGSPLVGARQERGGEGAPVMKRRLPCLSASSSSHHIWLLNTGLAWGVVMCRGSVMQRTQGFSEMHCHFCKGGGGLWTIWLYAIFTIVCWFVHQSGSYSSVLLF